MKSFAFRNRLPIDFQAIRDFLICHSERFRLFDFAGQDLVGKDRDQFFFRDFRLNLAYFVNIDKVCFIYILILNQIPQKRGDGPMNVNQQKRRLSFSPNVGACSADVLRRSPQTRVSFS